MRPAVGRVREAGRTLFLDFNRLISLHTKLFLDFKRLKKNPFPTPHASTSPRAGSCGQTQYRALKASAMGFRTFEQAWKDRILDVPTVDDCRQLRDDDFDKIKAGLNCSSRSGCWIWDGDMYNWKYPPYIVRPSRSVGLHRLLYHNFRGPLPDQAGVPGKDKLCVLHICKEVAGVDNNQLCCNPNHLKLGTKKENTAHLLAGHDGDVEHVSVKNRRRRSIKPQKAQRIAQAIKRDRVAGRLQMVKKYVKKYKISNLGIFYDSIFPLLKAKGIEFNYNAPGRSVQQIPDDFIDEGVSQILAEFTSDQLRPLRYYYGPDGVFGRKISAGTFFNRVLPRLPVEIRDKFSEGNSTAKFPPIEDDKCLEFAKIIQVDFAGGEPKLKKEYQEHFGLSERNMKRVLSVINEKVFHRGGCNEKKSCKKRQLTLKTENLKGGKKHKC